MSRWAGARACCSRSSPGESGPTLDQIAAKFGVTEVYAGCKDKAAALRDFAARHDLDAHRGLFHRRRRQRRAGAGDLRAWRRHPRTLSRPRLGCCHHGDVHDPAALGRCARSLTRSSTAAGRTRHRLETRAAHEHDEALRLRDAASSPIRRRSTSSWCPAVGPCISTTSLGRAHGPRVRCNLHEQAAAIAAEAYAQGHEQPRCAAWSRPDPAAPTPSPASPAPGWTRRRASSSPARSNAPISSVIRASACSASRRSTSSRSSRRSPSTR